MTEDINLGGKNMKSKEIKELIAKSNNVIMDFNRMRDGLTVYNSNEARLALVAWRKEIACV